MTTPLFQYETQCITATIPLCSCGSICQTPDLAGRWRCSRGHFARPLYTRSAA